MSNITDRLFRVMVDAEEKGDQELASSVKELIYKNLTGSTPTRDEVVHSFIELIRSKKVYDVQKEMETKPMNEIRVTTQVASLISWSLQAALKISPLAYTYLDIQGQVSLLSRLVGGGVPQDEVLSFYKRLIPEL